jgi:hypothetical protein
MNVKELISELKNFNPDLDVKIFVNYDGESMPDDVSWLYVDSDYNKNKFLVIRE